MVVDGLNPHTTYAVQIAAENSIGIGPLSAVYLIKTSEDGKSYLWPQTQAYTCKVGFQLSKLYQPTKLCSGPQVTEATIYNSSSVTNKQRGTGESMLRHLSRLQLDFLSLQLPVKVLRMLP